MNSLENLLENLHAKSDFIGLVQHAAACSPFFLRLLLANTAWLDDLLKNHVQKYSLAQMQHFLELAEIADENALKKRLRQLRAQVMLRLILRDVNQLADLAEVMETTSDLAEICLLKTVKYQQNWLKTSLGTPLNAHNDEISLIVIGMGKLGGRELNVSSDIDLIFAFEAEGEINNEENHQQNQGISHQHFFTQLGKKVIATLDEMTEHGFVFRVDMRLRPFGSEGVLASSLDALQNYYQDFGREWERYAWIKARVVVGEQAQLDALMRPFVFRKYLDFNALNSMRDLKAKIARDVLQKGLEDNIKLGRGGIREIEFIAQVFQLIRGGRDVSLQIKSTLQVLKLLKNKQLLDKITVNSLIEAYTFLRHCEHRLMYVEDQQTHDLPKAVAAQERIALSMNFANWPQFLAQLNVHRTNVQAAFDAVFKLETKESDAETALWLGTLTSAEALQSLSHLGFADAENSLQLLTSLRNSSRFQQLPELSQQRFNSLMPLVLRASGQMDNADAALLRSINLLESICRRASYLALLTEYPQALQLVVKLCATSPWLAQYLAAHPILLDELLDVNTLYAPPDFFAISKALSSQLQALHGDNEAQMDVLRHAKHSQILRLAAQDVMGYLSLEKLSDYLSDLADMILRISLPIIWQGLSIKHIETPKFSVIGYGKLGSKELGYVSDLDIIFLYDDDHERAAENIPEIYARYAQRINNWFNSQTNAGLLYETDLQLRPDGNSGLLVSSVAAFQDYQTNKAWTWEHQALTRARFVAGDADIGSAFEQIRIDVLVQTRDAQKLKVDVRQMREKMHHLHAAVSNMFDIKHDAGGIIDVEFIVQYLVLIHANKHQQLTDNVGNIELLMLLSKLKVIHEVSAEKLALAYRDYRTMQHALKLQGETHMWVEMGLVRSHVEAVTAQWQLLFDKQV